MSMNTSNVDIVKLLPQFMREDGAAQGISGAVNPVIQDISKRLDLFSSWDKIDELPEAELDEIAWELNLSWYDKAASIDIKRMLIKTGIHMHSKLGTKWAVETIIETYFGVGIIREWWEYAGEPGHFKVLSTNPAITNERFNEFLALLEKVKRTSAHLDGVLITLTNHMYLYHGFALHDVSRERHRIGADIILE